MSTAFTGLILRRRMAKSAISVGELARASSISIDSIKDYLRPSRKTNQFLIECLESLESQKEERFAKARQYLRASYCSLLGETRNFPRLDLPRFDSKEIIPFINLRDGYLPKRDAPTQGYTSWKKSIIKRFIESYTTKRPSNVVILGDPGMGKTTCLRIFLSDSEVFEDITPLVLPLHVLRENKTPSSLVKPLISHITEFHWHEELPDFEQFLQKEREDNRLVFVFDGLDEVASIGARVKIVTLAKSLKSPFILSTRPTRPDLTHLNLSATNYVISHLKSSQVIEYLDFLSQKCFDSNNSNKGKSIVAYKDMLVKKMKDHDLKRKNSIVEEFNNQGIKLHTKMEPAILSLLECPAILNLAVGMSDRLRLTPPSHQSLLDTYHDFVAEKGSEFRSLSPEGVERIVDRGDFLRILSAIAWLGFYKTEAESVINLAELQGLIDSWARLCGGFKEPQKQVEAALSGAVDCNLINREEFENGKIRFNLSHKHLLAYYAGRFIEMSTNNRALGDLFGLKGEVIRGWSENASFMNIMGSPTLGAAQAAVFHYLTRFSKSEEVGWGAFLGAVSILSDSPRVSPEDAGMENSKENCEKLHKLLPGNKLICWSLMQTPHVIKQIENTAQENFLNALNEWIKDQYKTTCYEHVFEYILNNCFDFVVSLDGKTKRTEDFWRFSKTFDDLDKGLATMQSFDLVLDWANDGDIDRDDIQKHIRILRRSIYIVRFFENDWSKDAKKITEWLCKIDTAIKQSKKSNEHTALKSLSLAVRTSFSRLNEISSHQSLELDDSSKEWIFEMDKACMKDQIAVSLQAKELKHCETPDDFLRIYCDDRSDFCLYQLGALHAVFHDERRDSRWFYELAKLVRDSLFQCQQKPIDSLERLEALPKEVRLCHLIIGLGQEHSFKMLFLPPKYSLGEIGINEIDSEYWDHSGEFLKLICKGALLPMDSELNQIELNDSRFSIGEFQLYDYYNQALWSLLGDDPRTVFSL